MKKMFNHKKYTEILQWHNGIEYFDYDLAIDWAVELIQNGIESENVLIVASFSKPVDREEIKPYISGALQELNLTEKYGNYSITANAHYHLDQILNDYKIRENLNELHRLCLSAGYKKGLMPFYLLHHGWCELEEIGVNYCFEGADLDNIEIVIKKQAQIWIDKYIHGISVEIKVEEAPKKSKPLNEKTNGKSIWKSIKNFWKNK